MISSLYRNAVALRGLARGLSTRSTRCGLARPFASLPELADEPCFDTPAKDAFGPFDASDPLAIAARLTDDERMIRETARSYSQQQLLPRIVDANRHGTFDRSIFTEMGSLGLLGAAIEGYGCAGASSNAYGLIANEVEKVDSAYRSMLSVQSSLVMHPIDKFGSEEQKKKFLPDLASGDLIGCFGLTEPDHGSDPDGMATRARYDAGTGEYVLDGSKHWITSSPVADVLLVWAKLDGVVRGFLIERDQVSERSLSTPPIDGKYALRASPTGSIFLENCRVPAANALPKAKGLGAPFSCLNSARFGIAWGALGAAEACYDVARTYVGDRVQFGAPLAANQLIQKKLADMATELALGYAATQRIGELKDAGLANPQLLSMAKRNSCGKARVRVRN